MSLNDNVMTLKSVTFYILNYFKLLNGIHFLATKNYKKKISICATRKQTKHLHHLLHFISFSRYLFLIMNFDLSRMLKAKVHIQICHADLFLAMNSDLSCHWKMHTPGTLCLGNWFGHESDFCIFWMISFREKQKKGKEGGGNLETRMTISSGFSRHKLLNILFFEWFLFYF